MKNIRPWRATEAKKLTPIAMVMNSVILEFHISTVKMCIVKALIL